jgi:hypothetical protein
VAGSQPPVLPTFASLRAIAELKSFAWHKAVNSCLCICNHYAGRLREQPLSAAVPALVPQPLQRLLLTHWLEPWAAWALVGPPAEAARRI